MWNMYPWGIIMKIFEIFLALRSTVPFHIVRSVYHPLQGWASCSTAQDRPARSTITVTVDCAVYCLVTVDCIHGLLSFALLFIGFSRLDFSFGTLFHLFWHLLSITLSFSLVCHFNLMPMKRKPSKSPVAPAPVNPPIYPVEMFITPDAQLRYEKNPNHCRTVQRNPDILAHFSLLIPFSLESCLFFISHGIYKLVVRLFYATLSCHVVSKGEEIVLRSYIKMFILPPPLSSPMTRAGMF